MKNPRNITDDLCCELYDVSDMPEHTYFQVLVIMSSKGYKKICEKIIAEKVTVENIEMCIDNFLKFSFFKGQGVYDNVLETLYYIKNEKM